MKERKIEEDSLVASKDKLATFLRKFYAEARKTNGEPSLHQSLTCRDTLWPSAVLQLTQD